MRNRRGFTLIEILVVVAILFAVTIGLTCTLGWGLNIYKLTQCDFAAPYGPEIIRGAGVFIAPVGCIAGFLELPDGPKDVLTTE